MLSNIVWNVFKQTGDINSYLESLSISIKKYPIVVLFNSFIFV